MEISSFGKIESSTVSGLLAKPVDTETREGCAAKLKFQCRSCKHSNASSLE